MENETVLDSVQTIHEYLTQLKNQIKLNRNIPIVRNKSLACELGV